MKLGKKLALGVSLALILLALTNLEVPPARAAEVCPQFVERDLSPSDISLNPDQLREEDPVAKDCGENGLIGEVICRIQRFFARFAGTGTLDLQDSQMPGYLRTANRLALSGDPTSKKPGKLTGGIAKMLMPGYTQDDLDPLVELTKAEGQLAKGEIILNNSAPQRSLTRPAFETAGEKADSGSGQGYYDLYTENSPSYQVQGGFGEIAPLYDRFGLLKQALMPSAGKVAIPKLEQSCADFDPSRIVVTGFGKQNYQRSVRWQAYTPIPEGDYETRLTCPKDDCPTGITSTYTLGGNLDTQSKVSLASAAWERIGAPSHSPGQGGVFNILLPPGVSFRTTDAEVQLRYRYIASRGTSSPTSAPLKIADLGNVQGATACIVNALTEHPANARPKVCDEATIAGGFGVFSGWPTEHGCITQGPRLGITHKNADAIDIGANRSIGWKPLGKPAMSTVSGRVEVACNNIDGCGSITTIGRCSGVPSCTGKWVSIVPDEGNFKIWYFHLDSVTVTEGQRVSPGTIVGTVGYSGNVFPRGVEGTHLHYEFKTSDMAPPKIPESPVVGFCW